MVLVPLPAKRKLLITFVTALAALAALVGLLAGEIFREKETLLASVRQENVSRARGLGREVLREFEKLDVLLLNAARELQPLMDQAANAKIREQGNRKLAAMLSYIPESQSLRVSNAEGGFVFDASGKIAVVSIHDRPYFQQQKQQHDSLVISEPTFARITNNWVLVLSRPIVNEQGRFMGLVQIALNTGYFNVLLKNNQFNKTDVAAIVGGQNQILIARQPEVTAHVGKPHPTTLLRTKLESDLEEDAFEVRSAFDDVPRSVAFYKIEHQKLAFIYARALEDVLAPWWEKVWLYALGVSILFFALIGIIYSWRRGYLVAVQTAKVMQDHAFKEAARLRTLIDSIPDLIWIKGTDLRFQAANLAFIQTIGRSQEEVIDAQAETLFPEVLAAEVTRHDQMVLDGKQSLRQEHVLRDPSGKEHVIDMIRVPIFGMAGETIGVAGIGRDITERKHTESVIRHMAEHDPLTDLPNRLLLSKYVAEMMATRRDDKHGVRMAVLFVDLDDFKRINDTLGHEIGDRLLQKVGHRLQQAVFENDIVSRHGGDEFTVLLLNSSTAVKTAQVAERVLASLAEPFLVDSHELTLTASVGVALYPDDGDDLAALLRNADTAMYSAKAAGRNTYRFFTAEMNTRIAERLALENSLRKALERDELSLHFQPQVEMGTGNPLGFEALVRWQHPERGAIPPMQFIPVAEESRLILSIGQWIMEEACRAAQTFQQASGKPLHMAINLSAVQFRQESLVDQVQACLDKFNLDPATIELELTESILLQDFNHALLMMTRFKTMGVRLAIDDFGTGYSSLSYLRSLPFDTLKIDKSFVDDLEQNDDDKVIAQTIIAMGSKLRMSVLAEGVETEGQQRFLDDNGCGLAQGYLFSRPMPLDQALDWLKSKGLL
ncbi:MAG TPA: EAL domain-containing protein [Rhodocyclaceae bacterium]|jgi:diguanylate cyclase (GGDEF)-like protein/PAS domain S-box-containing protein